MTLRYTTTIIALLLLAPLCSGAAEPRDIADFKRQLSEQQKQIDELRAMLQIQQALLARIASEAKQPRIELASLQPVIPAALPVSKLETFEVQALPTAPPAVNIRKMEDSLKSLGSDVEKIGRNLGGIAFSGYFRYRFDAQLRHANSFAPGLQNVRSRYRLRLNLDKEFSSKFRFRLQLATGPYLSQLTDDTDFGAFGVKAPFSIAEAYVAYSPISKITLKAGRMRDAFADDSRFVWDDDIRLNGFDESIVLPIKGGSLFKSIELRSGQYIITNPNTLIVPPDSTATPSPYARAGFPVGSRVGAANLFHPGIVAKGDLGSGWSQQLIFDTQVWRNPNQFALASTSLAPAGLINTAIGITLPGAIAASSNGLTTPGGPMFTAPDFTIARIDYRLDRTNFFTLRGKPVPGYMQFQAARNLSASFLRDSVMGTISIGATKKFGDMRFLYAYALKDANSLIGQFTDEDMGTGNSSNSAVHSLRFDFGLAKFLSWQNLLYIQDARRGSNASQRFFVVTPRGTNTTFRYQGQLVFTF